ncbi:MAG: hypothetical protein FJ225_00665 [Lentisphaerae bacterium]|nr:hypothetical protein [Lentisphaerota bacterium]
MNLLPTILLYVGVGCGEWYLALRRTLACARGEKAAMVGIVFIENLLGLWVLSNFIRTNNWLLALSYSSGAALGALLVSGRAVAPRPHPPENRQCGRIALDSGRTAFDHAGRSPAARGGEGRA